jgi:hypothetical protein
MQDVMSFTQCGFFSRISISKHMMSTRNHTFLISPHNFQILLMLILTSVTESINRSIIVLATQQPSNTCHACPPCFYKLNNKLELEFSSLVSIDGGNSLKQVGTAVRGISARLDTRSILSDHWLPPKEVDQFKDEVKPQVRGASVHLILMLIPVKERGGCRYHR